MRNARVTVLAGFLAVGGVSHLSGLAWLGGIARALGGEPDLLVLDEPVSSIDLETQQALARTLRVLASRGTTIALVAHALGPMAPLVTRTVVLQAGRVVYDGAPRPGDAETEHVHPHEPAGEAQWPAAVEP